jgi:hypothetical protein
MLEAHLSPGEARFGAARGAGVYNIGSEAQFSFPLVRFLTVAVLFGRVCSRLSKQISSTMRPESVNLYLGGPMHTRISKPGGGPQLRINC